MQTTLTEIVPIRGVVDGKGNPDPNVREAWLAQRRGGITATEIRDWGNASKRRKIIAGKVTGEEDDMCSVKVTGREYTLGQYADHGNLREPMIAAWIESRFGITPCDNVYTHGANDRFLASPDGISLDPFTGALIVGTSDAVLAEIKTSVNDLNPGKLDKDRVLVEIDQSSKFAKANYYTQMQWQMFVMQAARTLFVWEQHDDKIDPETGTFTPIGVPEYAWIPRDQPLIDALVRQAVKALEEIDAARVAGMTDGLPPMGDIPSEHAALIAEYFAGLDAEVIAKKRKEAAWKALQEIYLAKAEGEEFAPDQSIEIPGFAKLTVSTSSSVKPQFNEEGARKRAPKLFAQYEALVKRYTRPVPTSSQKLTITRPKVNP